VRAFGNDSKTRCPDPTSEPVIEAAWNYLSLIRHGWRWPAHFPSAGRYKE